MKTYKVKLNFEFDIMMVGEIETTRKQLLDVADKFSSAVTHEVGMSGDVDRINGSLKGFSIDEITSA